MQIYRKKTIISSFLELFSLLLLLSGILILSLAGRKACSTGCVETSCKKYNNYYECDCGSTCRAKTVVKDGVYGLGVSFIIIGIIGSIAGCILVCIYRRRYYYHQSPNCVIVQGGAQPAQFMGGPIIAYAYSPNMQQYQPNVQQFPPNMLQNPPATQQYSVNMQQNTANMHQPPVNVPYGYPIQESDQNQIINYNKYPSQEQFPNINLKENPEQYPYKNS